MEVQHVTMSLLAVARLGWTEGAGSGADAGGRMRSALEEAIARVAPKMSPPELSQALSASETLGWRSAVAALRFVMGRAVMPEAMSAGTGMTGMRQTRGEVGPAHGADLIHRVAEAHAAVPADPTIGGP